MVKYLKLGSKIIDDQKGRNVDFLFYDLESKLPIRLTLAIPNVYFTGRLYHQEAINKKNLLELSSAVNEAQSGGKIDQIRLVSSAGRSVIQVSGDRGLRSMLQKVTGDAFIDYLSSEKCALLRLPNFSIYEFNDGVITNLGRGRPEDFPIDLTMALDTEARKLHPDDKFYSDIFMNGMVKNEKVRFLIKRLHAPGKEYLDGRGFVLSEHDPELDIIRSFGTWADRMENQDFTCSEYSPPSLEVVLVDENLQIGDATKRAIKEFDPLVTITGQNIDTYDYGSLKEYAGFDLPKQRSIRGHIKEREIYGYLTLDTMIFSQMWLSLPNNKLATIANFYGFPFAKDLDYGEMQKLTDFPTEEGNRKLFEYNNGDIEISLKLSKRIMKAILPICSAYQMNPIEVCNDGFKVGQKLRDRIYFRTLSCPRQDVSRFMKDFDHNDEIFSLVLRLNDVKSRRGIFNNVRMVMPLMALNALALPYNEGITSLVEAAKSAEDWRDRLVLFRGADAYCAEPIFNLEGSPESIFNMVYKIEKDRAKKRLGRECANLSNLGFINRYQDLYFIESPSFNSDKFIHLATADRIISLGNGRMIVDINGFTITPGISMLGNMGLKCRFERETMNKYAELIMSKRPKEALAYFANRIEHFKNRIIAPSDLAYKVKRNSEVYSLQAQTTRRFRIIQESGLEKGDSVEYVYDDPEEMNEIMFGPVEKGKRKLKEGNLSSIILACSPDEASFHSEIQRIIDGSTSLKEWEHGSMKSTKSTLDDWASEKQKETTVESSSQKTKKKESSTINLDHFSHISTA